MAPRKPGPPDMSDTELRETLDLLSKVLANVSDRLDAQGEVLLELARARPDPELMAKAGEKAVRGSLEPLMHQLVETLENLLGNKAKLRQRLRDMRREEWAVSRWRSQLPLWLLLGGTLVVVLVLAFGAPRLLAGNATTCWLMGGHWVDGSRGWIGCAIWNPSARTRE